MKLSAVKGFNTFKKILSSRYLPFLTAVIALVCYYTGLDLVVMYYMAALGICMLIALDDLTPLVCQIPFMHVMVSRTNSPSYTVGGSDYYFQTAVLVQVIILITLLVGAMIYRIVMVGVKKSFKPTPVFFGLCALALTFLLNGVFSKEYDPLNLAYGVFMAFFFLGIFVMFKDNIKVNKNTFIDIAVAFMAFSIVLVTELAVAYLTSEGVFVNGSINRDKLMYGWGVHNTMGMLLVLCIPSATYLAGKFRYGFPLTLYSLVLIIAAFLSMSRQAMIGAVFTYIICAIILLVKGKNRIANTLIIGVGLIGAIIVVGLKQDSVFAYMKKLFDNIIVDGELNGSHRWQIWQTGIQNFISAPVFGVGFFVDIPHVAEMVGLDIIPLMYHNTFVQMLAACGILGLAAYLVHRVQTIICYFKNVTVDRSFIAVTVLSMLVISIIDNHLFYIFPTMIYSSLIAVLVQSQKAKY
ncbi:MAG: O-antigen ligase family protein [Clostridia bacterium]|nr:O-antigen ligase family protein [Clostridia bacterium]